MDRVLSKKSEKTSIKQCVSDDRISVRIHNKKVSDKEELNCKSHNLILKVTY